MLAEFKDGQLLLYRVALLSEKGLLLALQGTKGAPIGMMRAKALSFDFEC